MRRDHPARRVFYSSFSSYSSYTPLADRGEPGLLGAGTAGRAVVVAKLDETRAGGDGAPGFEITETAVAAAGPTYLVPASRIGRKELSTVICKLKIPAILRASD